MNYYQRKIRLARWLAVSGLLVAWLCSLAGAWDVIALLCAFFAGAHFATTETYETQALLQQATERCQQLERTRQALLRPSSN